MYEFTKFILDKIAKNRSSTHTSDNENTEDTISKVSDRQGFRQIAEDEANMDIIDRDKTDNDIICKD